jgi:hypothetical protein
MEVRDDVVWDGDEPFATLIPSPRAPGAVVDGDGVHARRHAPEPAAHGERHVERSRQELGHHVGPVGHLHLEPQTVDRRRPERQRVTGEAATGHFGAEQERLHRRSRFERR